MKKKLKKQRKNSSKNKKDKKIKEIAQRFTVNCYSERLSSFSIFYN
jgi:hypothetical protein